MSSSKGKGRVKDKQKPKIVQYSDMSFESPKEDDDEEWQETKDGADSMEVLSSSPLDGKEKRKIKAYYKKISPKKKAKKELSWLEGSQTGNEEEGSKC